MFARKVTLNGDILVDPDKDLPIIRSIAQNYYLAIDRALGLHKAYLLSLFGENERISLSKDLHEIAAMVVIGSTVYRPRTGKGEAYERSLERAILYNNVKDFYVHTYLPTLHADDTLDPAQLTYLLPYMLTEMFTMYTNDVEANLKKYFAKYVKLVASVRDQVDWLRRTQSNEW